MRICVRNANERDGPVLRGLLEISVRTLQARDYTAPQIEMALKMVYGIDTQLIRDGTYYVAESDAENADLATTIVGCGGWSRRRTLFGGDQYFGRQNELLDPEVDAA